MWQFLSLSITLLQVSVLASEQKSLAAPLNQGVIFQQEGKHN